MHDNILRLIDSVNPRSINVSAHEALRMDHLIDRKRADQRLEEMRAKIGEIDRAFIELLRQRMDLSAEIGLLKAATGQAIFVPEVHERVLMRARSSAQICGVSEEVMESIYEAVMHGSIERQDRAVSELHARAAAPPLDRRSLRPGRHGDEEKREEQKARPPLR